MRPVTLLTDDKVVALLDDWTLGRLLLFALVLELQLLLFEGDFDG